MTRAGPCMGHRPDWTLKAPRYVLIGFLLIFGGIRLWVQGGDEVVDWLTRRSRTVTLMEDLERAVRAYEIDQNSLPQGDGLGSAELGFSIERRGCRQPAYYEFVEGQRDNAGHILNPYGGPVYYLKSQDSFVLWTFDPGGVCYKRRGSVEDAW